MRKLNSRMEGIFINLLQFSPGQKSGSDELIKGKK